MLPPRYCSLGRIALIPDAISPPASTSPFFVCPYATGRGVSAVGSLTLSPGNVSYVVRASGAFSRTAGTCVSLLGIECCLCVDGVRGYLRVEIIMRVDSHCLETLFQRLSGGKNYPHIIWSPGQCVWHWDCCTRYVCYLWHIVIMQHLHPTSVSWADFSPRRQ